MRIFLKDKRVFMALFFLALCLRFSFYLVVLHTRLSGILPVRGDAARYQTLALNLLNGKGFVTGFHYRAYRPPAYPFFLAALYVVGGPRPALVRVVQFLLSSLSVVLFAALASRLFRRRVGILTGIILAAWPGLIYYSAQILSETLFIFLLALFFLFFFRLRPVTPWWRFGVVGALLGFSALCRPIMLPFSLLLFFLSLGSGFTKKSLLIYLFCALTIAPWTYRNYLVLSHFVPISTNGGINFLFGNNPDNPAGGANFAKGERFQSILRPEVEEDRAARRAAWAWIKDHPASFLKGYLHKTIFFWNPVPRYFSRRGSFGPYKKIIQLLLGALNLLTFILAGLGLGFLFRRRRDRRVHLLWLTPLYFTLTQGFFFVLYRFRLPVEPLVVILAAFAVAAITDGAKKRMVMVGRCPRPAGPGALSPGGRSRLKILFIVVGHFTPLSGVGRTAFSLARELSRENDLTVMASGREAGGAGHFHRVPFWQTDRRWEFFFPLPTLWNFLLAGYLVRSQRNNYEVIHVFNGLVWSKRAFITLQICQKGAISFFSGDGFLSRLRKKTPKHLLLLLLERLIYGGGHFNRLVVCSRVEEKEIIRFYRTPAEKISVLYNGVDLPSPREDSLKTERRRRLGYSPSDRVCLFVGYDLKRKGLKYALQALRYLPRDYKLLIVGGKDRAGYYSRIIRETGLSSRIRFAGPRADVAPFFGAADIFVFPTLYEPFGTVVAEALSWGLPVVCSRAAGAAELIRPGREGCLIADPREPREIASLILQIFQKGREQFSRRARETARQSTWTLRARELLDIYRSE